jgi:hypothetical protein
MLSDVMLPASSTMCSLPYGIVRNVFPSRPSPVLALQGQRLSSTEIQVLLRVLEQAELVPDTEEMGLDETLKRRTKALRAQKNTARAARAAGRGRRASLLGFTATDKDRAYEQNVRRLRVPKAASKARGEQAKQQLRAWRQQQAARQQQRLARQAVQLARLQLSASMAAAAGQTGDNTSSSSSSSSQGGSDAGLGAAAVDQAVPGVVAAAETAPADGSSASKSGWKSALAKMRRVFSQAVADTQQQQQQQQASSAAGDAYQQQVAAAAVAQQLQAVASSASGDPAGGDGQRIVIALVPLEQLTYIEQAWDTLAAPQL